MDLRERVLTYIQFLGLTTQKFEQLVGLSNGAVAKMGNNTRRSTIDKISNYFPELNPNWLLTGEGEMLKKREKLRQEVEDVSVEELELLDQGLRQGVFRMVPLINIDSVGGMHSGNLLSASEQYVMRMLPFTEAREGDVAILQSGNSMYPTIPSGSALLIREVVDWQEYFGYGNIYVLWLRDGRRITKEVRRYDPDPQNYVWCVSYNPDVADEELSRSMIRGVWKVVKYIADFGW